MSAWTSSRENASASWDRQGSGKSTLLNLIGCIDTPTAGTVIVDGEDTGTLGDARLSDFRNRRMGFIFQSFNLIPVLSRLSRMSSTPCCCRKSPPGKDGREWRSFWEGRSWRNTAGEAPRTFQAASGSAYRLPGPSWPGRAWYRGRANRLAGPCHRAARSCS